MSWLSPDLVALIVGILSLVAGYLARHMQQPVVPGTNPPIPGGPPPTPPAPDPIIPVPQSPNRRPIVDLGRELIDHALDAKLGDDPERDKVLKQLADILKVVLDVAKVPSIGQ